MTSAGQFIITTDSDEESGELWPLLTSYEDGHHHGPHYEGEGAGPVADHGDLPPRLGVAGDVQLLRTEHGDGQ